MTKETIDEILQGWNLGGKRSENATEIWQISQKNGAFRAVCVSGAKAPFFMPSRIMMEASLKARGLVKNQIDGADDVEVWQK